MTTTAAETPRAAAGSFAAFSNPSFRSFTIAGMLWLMADNIEHVISYWVIFDKFDSPMLGGYAVISHWMPYLLLATYMGGLADRVDCRKLFLASMGLFMFVSLGWAFVFWTDTVAVWHAALFLTLHGLAGVLFTPASQLMIHDIVEPQELTSAVRLNRDEPPGQPDRRPGDRRADAAVPGPGRRHRAQRGDLPADGASGRCESRTRAIATTAPAPRRVCDEASAQSFTPSATRGRAAPSGA